MKKTFKSFLALSFMFLSSVTFAAGGGIGTNNVNTELRTDMLAVGPIYVTSDSDLTAGQDGVIMVAPLGATAYNHVTQTSSIAAFPFPCKVNYKIVDGGSNSGFLSCSSLTLVGFNQFGVPVSEALTGTSSVSEASTAKTTTNVFESLSSVAATGCNSGGDGAITVSSSDILQLSCSLQVGLQFDIKNTDSTDVGAVLTACMLDASATHTVCSRVSGTSDSTILLKRSRVDFAHDSLDLSGTSIGGVAIADGDNVRIRYRAPNGRR